MEDTRKLTWSPKEAAQAMGISEMKLRELIKESDDCPAFKLGAAFIRIPIEPFCEWVNNLGKERYGLPQRPASMTFDLIRRKRQEKKV